MMQQGEWLDAEQFIQWKISAIAAARDGLPTPRLPRPPGVMASSSAYEPQQESEAVRWLAAELEKYLHVTVEAVGRARSR